MREINRIVVHCAATYSDMDIGSAEIREWHLDRGWSDIGYHYVIRRNGDVDLGRPVKRPGAHAKGYNMKSIGICLVGGLPDFNYTRPQMKRLEDLISTLLEEFPEAEVCGHNELSGKDCPQFNVKEWWYGSN